MVKYHVNSKGDPGVCRARKQCPFGSLETAHFPSADDARKHFERISNPVHEFKAPSEQLSAFRRNYDFASTDLRADEEVMTKLEDEEDGRKVLFSIAELRRAKEICDSKVIASAHHGGEDEYSRSVNKRIRALQSTLRSRVEQLDGEKLAVTLPSGSTTSLYKLSEVAKSDPAVAEGLGESYFEGDDITLEVQRSGDRKFVGARKLSLGGNTFHAVYVGDSRADDPNLEMTTVGKSLTFFKKEEDAKNEHDYRTLSVTPLSKTGPKEPRKFYIIEARDRHYRDPMCVAGLSGLKSVLTEEYLNAGDPKTAKQIESANSAEEVEAIMDRSTTPTSVGGFAEEELALSDGEEYYEVYLPEASNIELVDEEGLRELAKDYYSGDDESFASYSPEELMEYVNGSRKGQEVVTKRALQSTTL